MVDLGPRTSLFLWFASLTLEILMRLGFVNVGFFWAWTWATILDKSFKLIDSTTEAEFLEWADSVWSSLRGRNRQRDENNNRGGVELPIYNPRANRRNE